LINWNQNCLEAFLFASMLSPSKFSELVYCFYLTLMRVLKFFLGPGSLECLKVLLVNRQVVFSTFNGSTRLIFLKVIAPTIFLGVLVVLIIVFRFWLDYCPFLLEAIGASSLRAALLEVHLRLVWELFFPKGYSMCAPFWVVG